MESELNEVDRKIADAVIELELELLTNLNLKHEMFIKYLPLSCMPPLSHDSWDLVIDEGLVRPMSPEPKENTHPRTTPVKTRSKAKNDDNHSFIKRRSMTKPYNRPSFL